MTDWNRQGRFQGRTDVPLNDEGVAQVQMAAQRLRKIPFDLIVSSPLIRAVATAEIMAADSRKPINIEPELVECDFGSFEGRRIGEVMQEHGVTEKASLAKILPPDAERWSSVSERALRCLGRWLDRHPQSSILFVSHDAVMQSMAEALFGYWFENRHATPYRFAPTDDAWMVGEVD